MKRLLLIFILTLMPVLSVLARETVKGTVLDAKGNPIPGVRVEIPGNSEYVFTDLDGAFQIILREPTKNLKFTYPGYSPSTYKIKPEMTVVLGKAERQPIIYPIPILCRSVLGKVSNMPGRRRNRWRRLCGKACLISGGLPKIMCGHGHISGMSML